MEPTDLAANAAKVTIVVVPRERFSFALTSLESIYENSDINFELIYVDGGSPDHVKSRLLEESLAKGVQVCSSGRSSDSQSGTEYGSQTCDHEVRCHYRQRRFGQSRLAWPFGQLR